MAKLYYRYGAMGCGKTSVLLQVVYNYEEKEKKAILLKPSVDTKGNNKVVSRIGLEREVDYLIDKDYDITKINLKNIDVLVVDEAQFLNPKQIDQLYEISKMKNIPVICYGLRCDFQMNGFPGSIRLLEIADTIEEIKTICKCGKKATQNLRYINNKPVFDGTQIVIDGTQNVRYESVCGKCYLDLKNK